MPRSFYSHPDLKLNSICTPCGVGEVGAGLGLLSQDPNFGSEFTIENMEIRIPRTWRLARKERGWTRSESRINMDIKASTDFTFVRLNLSLLTTSKAAERSCVPASIEWWLRGGQID